MTDLEKRERELASAAGSWAWPAPELNRLPVCLLSDLSDEDVQLGSQC